MERLCEDQRPGGAPALMPIAGALCACACLRHARLAGCGDDDAAAGNAGLRPALFMKPPGPSRPPSAMPRGYLSAIQVPAKVPLRCHAREHRHHIGEPKSPCPRFLVEQTANSSTPGRNTPSSSNMSTNTEAFIWNPWKNGSNERIHGSARGASVPLTIVSSPTTVREQDAMPRPALQHQLFETSHGFDETRRCAGILGIDAGDHRPRALNRGFLSPCSHYPHKRLHG